MRYQFQNCEKGELWDGSRQVCISRTDIEMVGDSKLPNKYFITLGNAEYICTEGTCDCDESIEGKGGTVAVFDSFKDALEFMNSIPIEDFINIHGEDFLITQKIIEDRLSGEVASEIVENWTRTVKDRKSDLHIDTKFTEKEMEKRGVRFE